MALIKALVVLLFVPCLVVPLTEAKPVLYNYCGDPTDYAVKDRGLDIEPYPNFLKGTNITIKIAATTDRVISGGSLKIDGYIIEEMPSPVGLDDEDLCTLTTCPVSVGDFIVTVTWPIFQEIVIPTEFHKFKLGIQDSNDNPLTCITFHGYITKMLGGN